MSKISYDLLNKKETQQHSSQKYFSNVLLHQGEKAKKTNDDGVEEERSTSLRFNTKTSAKVLSRKNLIRIFINTRCTEQLIWASSTTLGVLLLCMQITPIFLLDWVHITEPRPVNRTNDKGESLELPFFYNVGYFRACRHLSNNLTEYGITSTDQLYFERQHLPKCVWNPIYINEDLSDFSFGTNAILDRLGESIILHVTGSICTILAFVLSISGHINKNAETLFSALIYFVGGLSVMAGILQMICVVDDEMYPRMKSKNSGEPSLFTFHYGYSFLFAALSFLPIQVCIYLQTSAFFLRFPDPQAKALIVPGLSKLLQQVSIIRSRTHKLGKCSVIGGNTSESDAREFTRPHSISGSISGTNLGGGSLAGVSVNFANRQRRESRAASKDFNSLGIYQEVRKVGSPLTECIIRRSSSQLQI